MGGEWESCLSWPGLNVPVVITITLPSCGPDDVLCGAIVPSMAETGSAGLLGHPRHTGLCVCVDVRVHAFTCVDEPLCALSGVGARLLRVCTCELAGV